MVILFVQRESGIFKKMHLSFGAYKNNEIERERAVSRCRELLKGCLFFFLNFPVYGLFVCKENMYFTACDHKSPPRILRFQAARTVI